MVRNQVRKKVVEVPILRKDGNNWVEYREKLFKAAEQQNLLGLLDGTYTRPEDLCKVRRIGTWMRDNLEAQALIIATKPPTPRFSLLMTAHEMFNTLKDLCKKTTTAT